MNFDQGDVFFTAEAGHLPTLTVHREPRADWVHEHDEGRLAVDVFETDEAIVVQSAIAGINPNDLDIFVNNDMLTIRGVRKPDQALNITRHLVNECHWGAFSRSIILPCEVNAGEVMANLKDGVLTVKLPKILRAKKIAVHKSV